MLWAIVIGVVILVIAGLSGSRARKPSRPILVTTRSPTVGDPDFASALSAWRAKIAAELPSNRWIPKSMAQEYAAMHPSPVWKGSSWANPNGKTTTADLVRSEIKKHNDSFLVRQRKARKDFFDTVEKNPLTNEQVDACICMDDNVMVVAAAGSGKTSTMIAKAGYVIREGLAGPDEILMLAFNSAAAKELGERVTKRLAGIPGIESISAQTFHAFGLTVIGAATGQKPRLAPWVDKGEEGKVMAEIANHLIATDGAFARDWGMFRTIYAKEMRSDGKSDPDGYKNGRRGLTTASGDVVKSDEERRIADWLFFCGIKFEYERAYEHETADEQHSSYHPDFYYPDHGLYHEHFAIDREGHSHFGSAYEEGVAWKRALHKKHGTELFETASHEMRLTTEAGRPSIELALLRLEDEFAKRGQILAFDANREMKGFQPTSDQALVKLIKTFQRHVKNNGLTQADLYAKIETMSGDKARLHLFVSIYERLNAVWDQKLREGNYIDFEDMLIQAAEHIEQGRYTSPFKVVLADEFQDSSRARVRMLKALTSGQRPGTHLCVVGDDWQGINRFAGSDIAVMTEFERQFDSATRLILGTTFRCPKRICEVSSNFVQRNPAQIRKQVRTTNTIEINPIRIFGFKEMEASQAHIESELGALHDASADHQRAVSVLFLGRYRDDQPYLLQQWQRRFGDRLDISYRTIHASKGLEAEHVFLLNVVGGNRGFPSQIEDDAVLQIAMPSPDDYRFAEERRLFYVALTRASKDIRIYTSLGKPSIFVNEVQTQENVAVEAIGGEATVPCPKCNQGTLKLRKGKHGPFLGCSSFPKCDYTQRVTMLASGAYDTAPPPSPQRPASQYPTRHR
jgi:DNA helicase-4